MEKMVFKKKEDTKSSTSSSNIPNQYKEISNTLQMIAIPYIGIYLNEYLFMNPFLVLKKKTPLNHISKTLSKQLTHLENKFNITPEYFHVTLDASPLFELYNERKIGEQYLRVNIAPHPFIFKDGAVDDMESEIYICTYKDEETFDSIKDTEEKDGVRINPDCNLSDDSLKRGILLHPTEDFPALSPNNCAILINLNNQIISFYLVVIGQTTKKVIKCFVGKYVIFPHFNNNQLFSQMLMSFLDKKSKENLLKEIYNSYHLYLDSFTCIFDHFSLKLINNNIVEGEKDVNQTLRNAFKLIYSSPFDETLTEMDIDNISNFYLNNLYHFIRNNLYKNHCDEIANFSESILTSSKKSGDKFILELLQKYKFYHLSIIKKIYESYIIFLDIHSFSSIDKNFKQNYIDSVWNTYKERLIEILNISKETFNKESTLIKKRNRVQNKHIEMFYQISSEIINGSTKDIIQIVNKMDPPMQKFLFHNVWICKGKIQGIHKDFGLLSFIQSNDICIIYHLQNEEIYNFSVQMAEFLEDLDSKYLTIEE